MAEQIRSAMTPSLFSRITSPVWKMAGSGWLVADRKLEIKRSGVFAGT